MTGFDHDFGNRPGPSIDQKICDLADCSVGCLNFVAFDNARAAKVCIGLSRCHLRQAAEARSPDNRRDPTAATFRVIRIAIVTMKFLFVLTRHGLVLINRRALFDLVSCQVDEKHLSSRIKMTQRMGEMSTCDQ